LRFGFRIPWDWLAFQGPPLTEPGSEAVGSHAKLGVLSKIVEELDCWSLENRVSGNCGEFWWDRTTLLPKPHVKTIRTLLGLPFLSLTLYSKLRFHTLKTKKKKLFHTVFDCTRESERGEVIDEHLTLKPLNPFNSIYFMIIPFFVCLLIYNL
jgi:hypothetical protein